MKRNSLKRKRFVIPVVVVVALIAAGFFWASSGNKGTITQATSAKRVEAPAFKQFDGQNISFTYKGTYLPQKLEAKGADLELYMLRATTLYNKQLAVAVSQSPTGRANADSGYILRESQPSVYTKRDITVDGGPASLWVKNDGSEQTVFIVKANRIAILSFNTTGNTDNLQPEVDALLATFRWK